MPFIRIYGIPLVYPKEYFSARTQREKNMYLSQAKTEQEVKLEKLVIAIQTRLESSKDEFKISKKSTTIFFPPDLLGAGLGEEIIVDLGLREKEGRTDEVIAETADAIVQIIRKFFPDVPLIECFPNIISRAHFAQLKL